MAPWPDLDEWDRWTDERRLKCAEAIAAALPQKPVFTGLKVFSLGTRRRTIATFQVKDASFSFVPGGSASLGYDARTFQPTPEQLESYRRSAREYGLGDDIRAFLGTTVGKPRRRVMAPLLVEQTMREIGLEPIDPQSPEAQKLLKQRRNVEIEHDKLRVRREAGGQVRAWRIIRTTHPQVRNSLERDGFRLLQADEWEYACSGGATTLFRWGDACPSDRYPVHSANARNKLKEWSQHRAANAFGLMIAWDPYKYEIVEDSRILRGGDGGCYVCGGAGFFLGWLPLATSFVDPATAEAPPDEDCSNLFVRRAIPL